MHNRALIREYLTTVFKASVDVGERVFFMRPDPAFMDELPLLVFGFTGESVETHDGDEYFPRTYKRVLGLSVDIMTRNGPDHLDYLGYQVERAIADDHLLAKRLTGYNPENPDGLSAGITLKSLKPSAMDTEGETFIYGQNLTFEVPYLDDVIGRKKFDAFEQFAFDIHDTDIINPVVISGEVDL